MYLDIYASCDTLIARDVMNMVIHHVVYILVMHVIGMNLTNQFAEQTLHTFKQP